MQAFFFILFSFLRRLLLFTRVFLSSVATAGHQEVAFFHPLNHHRRFCPWVQMAASQVPSQKPVSDPSTLFSSPLAMVEWPGWKICVAAVLREEENTEGM